MHFQLKRGKSFSSLYILSEQPVLLVNNHLKVFVKSCKMSYCKDLFPSSFLSFFEIFHHGHT